MRIWIVLGLALLTAAAPAGAEDGTQPLVILPIEWTGPEEGAEAAEWFEAALRSRFVQTGQFRIQDEAAASLESALAADGGLMAITGRVAQVQSAYLIRAERWRAGPSGPILAGSAVAHAARLQDVVGVVDSLIAELFTDERPLRQRQIEHVMLVPSVLRVRLGESRRVEAVALDAAGQPIPDVMFIYQSGDTSKLAVDADGRLIGMSPGQTTLTARAIGSPARGSPVAQATVQVMAPSLGLRIGTGAFNAVVPKIGLRFTPSTGIAAPVAAPPGTSLLTAVEQPTAYLGSIFSQMLSGGLLTVSMDIEPERHLAFTLEATQRSPSSFFGSGVGFVTPLSENGAQGVSFRLTFGSHQPLPFRPGLQLPIEANFDLVLPVGGDLEAKTLFGASIGFDLYP